MGITTEQYERIIRFLDAEMEPAEMDAFEKELSTNPEMRRQLDFEQALRDDFALHNITNLSGTLPIQEEAVTPKITSKVTGMWKWWTVGAAAVAIITLTLFATLWQKPENAPDIANRKNNDTGIQPRIVTITPEKDSNRVIDLASLFKQYFKKDTIPDDYPVFLAEALVDYDSGNYMTLQQLNLNDLPQTRSTGKTDNKDDILQLGHYYKGLAFLQTNNARQAVINLTRVLDNQPDKVLRAKAEWYLALAYLKENNVEKVTGLCKSIINNKENDILIKNAESMLNALKK